MTVPGDAVLVTWRGRQVTVILGPGPWDQLAEAAEDASERFELYIARDEDDYVHWDEVKADLGME